MGSGSAHISTRWRGEPGEGPIRTPADHVLDRTADIAQKDLDNDKAPPLAPAETQVDDSAAEPREEPPRRRGLGRALDWLRRANRGPGRDRGGAAGPSIGCGAPGNSSSIRVRRA